MADLYLYLMRRRDRRWKLGYSQDPDVRRRALGTSFFKIVHVWQTPNAYRIEQIAHRLLRPYRDDSVPGKETFKAPKAVIMSAVDEAIRIAAQQYEPPPQSGKRRTAKLADPAQAARTTALADLYAQKMAAIRTGQEARYSATKFAALGTEAAKEAARAAKEKPE